MKAYKIYDKNNDNTYVGFVIALNEEEATEKVINKHSHFSGDKLEIVWEGSQGIHKEKSFGLEEISESITQVIKYSNVID